MLSRRRINLAMMSAIAMIGMCSPAEAGLTATPYRLDGLGDDPPKPFDPPKPLGPPPLTPEQIKAQEKRARRAVKRARE